MTISRLLVATLLGLGANLAQAQTAYVITRIDPPPGLGTPSVATAISPGGVVAAYGSTPQGLSPFTFSAGVAQTYAPLPGYTHVTPSAINDQGQIAGTATLFSGPRTAYLYSGGVYTDLRTLTGGADSVASGMNASGAVVGTVSGTLGARDWAFLYQGGVLTNLGTLPGYGGSQASGINAAGHIAGNSYDILTGYAQGFIRSGGTLQSIGRLAGAPGARATGINDADHVVGVSGTAAFFYSNGVMQDLGALPGDVSATAWGVNNHDVVIGSSLTPANTYRGFVYQNGVMTDLTSLLQNGEGWTLSLPSDINDAGQIVGYGLYNGVSRGFLLTPVPEPAVWLALLAGLPLIAARGVAARRCAARR